jgi:hypothetical protein
VQVGKAGLLQARQQCAKTATQIDHHRVLGNMGGANPHGGIYADLVQRGDLTCNVVFGYQLVIASDGCVVGQLLRKMETALVAAGNGIAHVHASDGSHRVAVNRGEALECWQTGQGRVCWFMDRAAPVQRRRGTAYSTDSKLLKSCWRSAKS